ncbi:MAG: Rieske 2Fe-2S domain-containing protein [Alphaproteobacteria bacterium]|nr:Rieske 2Fe-2S domain-containing protein [Alphaproteobacteria bacterium]
MTLVCRADEIAEGCARGVIVGEGAERRDIVLVRRHGVLRAYVNSCPHQGVPLETFPDKFLTMDGSQFICSAHGARFRVEDGVCVSGPCLGKALASVPVTIAADGSAVI